MYFSTRLLMKTEYCLVALQFSVQSMTGEETACQLVSALHDIMT